MALVAAALGIDFVSGRALATFYAQMGDVSWAGIALSGVLYGLMIAQVVRLSRRCGAQSAGEFLNRLPGGGMGKGTYLLYICIMLLAAGMLVCSAGEMGALVLPVHRAGLLGGALAVLAACIIAFAGGEVLQRIGGTLILLMLVFELALLMFAQLPDAPHYEIELRLQNNWYAALGFALLHTAACLCLSAGLAVKLSGGRIRAGRMGMCAGVVFSLMLTAGNGVLMARDERILALKLPFVALSADWGGVGFYLNTGMSWLFCVFSLAGLIYGFLPVRCRANPLGK